MWWSINREINLNPTSQSILAHGTLKRPTELTDEPLPVHNKTNIKLNSCIYLSFTCVTRNISMANLTHGHCLWRAVLTDFTAGSGCFWMEAAIGCLRAISDGMIRVECRHTNFNSYLQIEDH